MGFQGCEGVRKKKKKGKGEGGLIGMWNEKNIYTWLKEGVRERNCKAKEGKKMSGE